MHLIWTASLSDPYPSYGMQGMGYRMTQAYLRKWRPILRTHLLPPHATMQSPLLMTLYMICKEALCAGYHPCSGCHYWIWSGCYALEGLWTACKPSRVRLLWANIRRILSVSSVRGMRQLRTTLGRNTWSKHNTKSRRKLLSLWRICWIFWQVWKTVFPTLLK